MLKLDLLPAHYTVARRNRKVIFLSIPLLVGTALLWLLVMVQMNSTITKTQAQLDETKAAADKVRALQSATESRKAELKPIQDKVDFVLAADKCGQQYWDAFYEVNKYIFNRALVTRFSLTPPDAVAFDVEVESTEDAGRFILNLIRCPAITAISISGQPVGGGTIAGISGASPAAAAGAGAPGGEMGPGMPGAPPGGGPGAAPGGAPAPAAGAAGPIRFSVTAKLVKPLSVPQPPSGAAAAPAGGAGGPGGPGGPPGAAGGPPPGGGGQPGAGPPGGEDKGGDEDGGGGGKGGDAGGGGGDE